MCFPLIRAHGQSTDYIDGVNEDIDTLLLGDCKWTTDPVDTALLEALKGLESEVRCHGSERNVAYVLFSKAGFTDAVRSATTRDDFYCYTRRISSSCECGGLVTFVCLLALTVKSKL